MLWAKLALSSNLRKLERRGKFKRTCTAEAAVIYVMDWGAWPDGCSLSAFFILHRHPRRGFQHRVWVCALERDIVAVPRLWHSWPLSAGSWALGRSRTSMDELLSSAGAT